MNLATGIAKLCLTEPWTSRIEEIDEEVALRFRVWPLDLDYNGHMNNARYFVAMELVRLALMKRAGLLLVAVKNRWVFANAAQKAVFFRPLGLFQRYTVSCRVLHMDRRWLYLKQHVRSQDRLTATGLFKMGIKEGPERLSPPDVVARIGFGFPERDPPPEVTEWEGVNAVLLAEMKNERRTSPS